MRERGNRTKRIALFGATGSIGRQVLDIVRAHPDELAVCCVAANSSAQCLAEAAREFHVDVAALTDLDSAERFRASTQASTTRLFAGSDAMLQALHETNPDIAVIAVSGMSGLPLLSACLENDVCVALANKEAIVAGADVIARQRNASDSVIRPLDSEHAALYQCLGDSFDVQGVRNLWITASGGPFLHWTEREIAQATPEQALAHPTWDMGRKITVDCATLANKGLEVIEAHYLFRVPPEHIRVVVQPRSLIHSMVEFNDTSVLAQFAPPDMHLPIRRALLGPAAEDAAGAGPLDFWEVGSISFEKPDVARFPSLALAYEAIRTDSTAVYNAADEAAVFGFLDGRINFGDIPRLTEAALERFQDERPDSIAEILSLDERVRRFVNDEMQHTVEGV